MILGVGVNKGRFPDLEPHLHHLLISITEILVLRPPYPPRHITNLNLVPWAQTVLVIITHAIITIFIPNLSIHSHSSGLNIAIKFSVHKAKLMWSIHIEHLPYIHTAGCKSFSLHRYTAHNAPSYFFLASTGSPGSHSVCVCVCLSVCDNVHFFTLSSLCRSGRYFVLFKQ